MESAHFAFNCYYQFKINMEPPAKKPRKLLDDDSSDSGDEDGGVSIGNHDAGFKINEEYARRFEHNKKREELQQCMFCFNPYISYILRF